MIRQIRPSSCTCQFDFVAAASKSRRCCRRAVFVTELPINYLPGSRGTATGRCIAFGMAQCRVHPPPRDAIVHTEDAGLGQAMVIAPSRAVPGHVMAVEYAWCREQCPCEQIGAF